MPHIVGYTFNAENYCPRHVGPALTSDARYDGWQLAKGARMSPEADLDEIAAAFGIDRRDEHSFDSGDFPKVITRQMALADGGEDRCGWCHELLVEE